MTTTSATFTIGKKGRVVIPAPIRKAAGIDEGTEAVVHVDDMGRVVIDTPTSIKARIRRRAAVGSEMGGSAVEQLLADRRTDTSLLD